MKTNTEINRLFIVAKKTIINQELEIKAELDIFLETFDLVDCNSLIK